MTKPRLLFLSLGGTITMVPTDSGGIAPKLGAAELVKSVPALADIAQIDARSPFKLPSSSLTTANLVEVARLIEDGFKSGFDGAVVSQGTDTIEESAFILDLLIDSEKPVVMTGAMRGADSPGADGPANLLSSAIVAASPDARGLGTLGVVAERVARFYARVKRNPSLPSAGGPPVPIALVKVPMGDDGRILRTLPDLGFAGAVIEGMGAGHVHADVAPILGDLVKKIPVVLASRAMTGPVFTHTYGYPGAEIDLIDRGLVPAGYLSGLKARLVLGLCLRGGASPSKVRDVFAPYQ